MLKQNALNVKQNYIAYYIKKLVKTRMLFLNVLLIMPIFNTFIINVDNLGDLNVFR